MLFDTVIDESLGSFESEGARLEALGYAGVHVTELGHDPFISATRVALATDHVDVGTQVAIAFARNPATVAYSARDVQDVSGGRFVLGLGTQVSAHVTKRFSMPWSHPAARMSEFVSAMRAIWEAWETGERLQFRGEYYTHTLMTPMFSPPPAPHGLPPVYLAAMGPLMATTAGRVADGVFVHPLSSVRYLEEIYLPAVEQGIAESGRSRADVTVSLPCFVVSGATESDRAASDAAVRERIAFYASTPAYKRVLELHGWGELADRLHELSVSREPGAWKAMGELIGDDVLDAFAIAADPGDVLGAIEARYGRLIDRASVEAPRGVSAADWSAALAAAS